MAQQAALRVWCDRSGSRRVAIPDLSHLLKHEDDGPRRVHGFEFEQVQTMEPHAWMLNAAGVADWGPNGRGMVRAPAR